MKHIPLDNQPEVVREFIRELSVSPDGALLEIAGHVVACIVPPPAAMNGGSSVEWTETLNNRRCDLIDKKYESGLTPAELTELALLQEEMLRYRRRVAPIPLEDARRLHQQLLGRAGEQSVQD